MSRIPKVRPWRVTFYHSGTRVASVLVETINKRFAYWLAFEQAGYPYPVDRTTVSLVKGK